VVLDTHIVLDLWVFRDTQTDTLRTQLESQALSWLATRAMRDELARVLHYPLIEARCRADGIQANTVLTCFDRHATPMPAPPASTLICQDPDDQVFIDLAVAHQSDLISRDKAVLRMTKRLATQGVRVHPLWPPLAMRDR
jgi:putative PIN family toxin of toxin-antitoxin system